MPKEWFQRLWLVLVVVVGSLYLLVPTFFWHPKEETVAKVEASATGTPVLHMPGDTAGTASIGTPAIAGTSGAVASTMPGWMSAFPKIRLHFGLDLVGGSHLALGVDTEEA